MPPVRHTRYDPRCMVADVPFITRVRLRYYKSISQCDVPLGPLVFMVGPNGSGKSNFLDSLRLVAESLRTTLDHALRERGGVGEVRKRSGGHPTHFRIHLEFKLPSQAGKYSFRIGAKPHGGFEVQDEECRLIRLDGLGTQFFKVKSGRVISFSGPTAPPATSDRLFLVNAAGFPEFRELFEALSHMGFYNLNPDAMREHQAPNPGDLLLRDGSNIASTLARLAQSHPERKERIEKYLAKVVPGVKGVERAALGTKETLVFRQEVVGAKDPWRFYAANMSDGTVRVVGILAALFQATNGGRAPLIGIEEPEVALHPGATGALLDALRETSKRSQVIVTSHSPDLLDDERIDPDSVLAVVAHHGETHIGRLDEHGRTALRQRLYTAGELLRLNQMTPERPTRKRQPSTVEQLLIEADRTRRKPANVSGGRSSRNR